MMSMDSLNPQQRVAVETIRGPVLILAGAGTGKTRVITYRIAHMIERGIEPGRILAVTFTNKAAREMQERVGGLIGRGRGEKSHDVGVERPTIATFHSLCVRILRQHIERFGYKRNFVIFSESDQYGTVRKLLSRITGPGVKLDAGEVQAMISRAKNGQRRPGGSDLADALLDRLLTQYDQALRACNAVDFDDLLLLVARLFREHEEVLETCRDRFRFVMVDEYQDTNAIQFEIVKALSWNHRNLCVVGDDDQSIYGWRGAEIANLLDLERHFPEVKIVKLEQNYRSTNTILNVANAVIRHNLKRRGKQLWSRHGVGDRVRLIAYANEEEEARGVAAAIEFDRLAHRIPWSDQAVLFRTNAQSRPLEMAFRSAGVRYRVIGGQSFFDRREIKDVMAYLKVVVNPFDDISLLRIANTPARGLSEATMQQLLALSHGHHETVYQTMRRPDVQSQFAARAGESIRAFLGLLEAGRRDLETLGPGSLGRWAEGFLGTVGYLEDLRRSEKDPETGENRVRNVKDFLADLDREPSAAPGQGGGATERLEAWLQDVLLDEDRREEEVERRDQSVTLITMHSCKGLEFPFVHIVGLENGLLPHERSRQEGTLDEERRLFYVAITRAMKSLRISHCGARKRYGAWAPCHPSPFLAELPREWVELDSEQSKKPVTVDRGRSLFAGVRAAVD